MKNYTDRMRRVFPRFRKTAVLRVTDTLNGAARSAWNAGQEGSRPTPAAPSAPAASVSDGVTGCAAGTGAAVARDNLPAPESVEPGLSPTGQGGRARLTLKKRHRFVSEPL